MYVIYNDEIKYQNELKIDITSSGLLLGHGLFETIRVHRGRICFFEEHMKRLIKDCALLKLDFDIEAKTLYHRCTKLIELNQIQEGSLKITYIKDAAGYSLLVNTTSRSYSGEQYQRGFRLCMAQSRRNSSSILSCIKAISYMENLIARQAAIAAGYDEALFLNEANMLAECSISNIFWIKSRQLFTPHISCGLLPGITRRQILDIAEDLQMDVFEGSFGLEAISSSDEIFITNSLMGVMPVSRLEDKLFDIEGYKIYNMISREYQKLLKK